MISTWFVLTLLFISLDAGSLFDNLPDIISDPAHSTPSQNNNHQFLFHPIGQYATDVHYAHMRVPFPFLPIFESLAQANHYLSAIDNQADLKVSALIIQDIVNPVKCV